MIVKELQQASDLIFNRFQKNIRLATPLGLGKPNQLLNLIYDRAKANPSVQLTIFTALSLNPPAPSEDLAKRFLSPFAKRQWGADYPGLQYELEAQRASSGMPKNITVHEFYFQAGAALHSNHLQRNYQSINYTAVVDAVFHADIQVLVQLIARRVNEKGEAEYSLSCNPDLTLDLADRYQKSGKKLMIVGVIHPELPFMGAEAQVEESFFEVVVDDPKVKHQIFALPRMPIHEKDHAIGFYASQLIRDDGTLQVGIGSLSDAVVNSLLLRHQKNDLYLKWSNQLFEKKKIPMELSQGIFKLGLYGLSEMITDGFMHLRRAGILKREVKDEDTGVSAYLHGAFYLGSKEFYQWLRTLSPVDYAGLRMSRISKINDLYDPQEMLLRKQRKNGRFLNTCMQVTLLGGAASETLENGKVISGVGGQYNFVSMAHELEGGRSILMLRSTRLDRGKRSSNVVWSHGQLTIPRHLRDVVITEYGIADIRNKTDEETITALLCIADSEFQEGLLAQAKKNGKVSVHYEIPAWAKNNTPEQVKLFFHSPERKDAFKSFALGSDFTPAEEALAVALGLLEELMALPLSQKIIRLLALIQRSFKVKASLFEEELERMQLSRPQSFQERLSRKLLIAALSLNERDR